MERGLSLGQAVPYATPSSIIRDVLRFERAWERLQFPKLPKNPIMIHNPILSQTIDEAPDKGRRSYRDITVADPTGWVVRACDGREGLNIHRLPVFSCISHLDQPFGLAPSQIKVLTLNPVIQSSHLLPRRIQIDPSQDLLIVLCPPSNPRTEFQ